MRARICLEGHCPGEFLRGRAPHNPCQSRGVFFKTKSFKTKLHFRVDFTTGVCNGNADIILIMRENFSRMEMR